MMDHRLYRFLQCTWGIPQTLIGAILFLRYINKDHSIYHGSILTKWDRSDGISLGLFIFVPDNKKMTIHEYGHTIQSLILGPLYLPVVGTISLLWSSLPIFKRMREEKSIPYSYCFTESWADRLGEKFT
jgi:hypothetical protein